MVAWKVIPLLLISFFAKASEPSQRLVARIKGYFSSPYGYLEYLPQHYNQSTRYPLVIYLHGIKETGSGMSPAELDKVARNGVPHVIRKYKRNFPFIMIAPQSPGLEDGFRAESVEKLIEIITENYAVDPERIYVTGVSYGAFAAWRLASYMPDKLAAIVPFSSCGGGYDITRLSQVPVWAFANAGDKQEVPDCMQDLVSRIRNHGGTPLLTLHPKKGHNAWERTYKAQYMWDWLLAQRLNKAGDNHSPHLINPGDKVLPVGAEAKYSLMVSDRDNDSITFHIDGPLAKGSRFNIISNGYAELILNTLRPGLFNVSVSVSDGKGGFSTQQFSLHTSFSLLFNSYILLLVCQPFVIGLPLCFLFIFLVLMERLIHNCFALITKFFYWLVILILILPAFPRA